MFKNGTGMLTVYDKDYGAERSFQLYDEHRVLAILKRHNMGLVEEGSDEKPGGIMYFTDPRSVDHCVFYTRKVS
ncbi:MAG: hypothetical protein ISS55_10705 [Dehalococcoidales bacterium]|nr:hypothetical protein [Dehalococcoidales bacterium]